MSSNSYHKKYSNYHSCAVLECKNTTISAPGKLWIKVPKEINMRNIWLIRAKRDPATMSTKTQLYFCQDHFDLENDMENYMRYKIMGSVKKIRIKPDCVPSRFECPNEKERKPMPTSKLNMQRARKKRAIIPDHNYAKKLSRSDYANSNAALNPGTSHKTANEELKQSVCSGYEIKAFCPKCNTEVAHTAGGIQEDPTKAFIAKVFHYFEHEFEVLKKMNAKLILSNLAKFRYRTAMATGLSETAVLEILQEEARRNAAMRGVPQNDGEPQEPPQHAVKPQKPSQKVRKKHKESSNEKTDDNIEDNGQSGVVQDMKFNLEIETIVVKAEPVDYYNEEPAMNIEPEHAKALNDEQVQIEPIFIHVKLEPPDEEMNEPHTQDESLTTAASSSYQPTETLHDIKNEPQAETLPVVKADPVQYHKEKIVKTKAQRQKEYRQRKKMENRTERKIRKTNAQYHQTYREKQKKKQLSESEESKHARNKANAERAKRYRENKKIQLQSEPLDSSLARKKNNAERTKRYREKLKSIKKYTELETVQSFPTVSMESNEETDIIFNQFQKNRIQSSVNDEAQSSLLGEREIKVEKIEIGEEGYS